MEDRREFQRLDLPEPLPARLGSVEGLILDLGVLGARVSHEQPVEPGTESRLEFEWDGKRLSFQCGIVHSHPAGSRRFQSGLRFFRGVDDSDATLRMMLTRLVSHRLDERLSGSPVEEATIESVPADGSPLVTYWLEEDRWRSRGELIPEQPATGFTVAADEDETEMKRLCLAYELENEEGRRLIKLFAELSIFDKLGMPKRRQA